MPWDDEFERMRKENERRAEEETDARREAAYQESLRRKREHMRAIGQIVAGDMANLPPLSVGPGVTVAELLAALHTEVPGLSPRAAEKATADLLDSFAKSLDGSPRAAIEIQDYEAGGKCVASYIPMVRFMLTLPVPAAYALMRLAGLLPRIAAAGQPTSEAGSSTPAKNKRPPKKETVQA